MKKTARALAISSTLLLSSLLTLPCQAQVNASAADDPMPQTREHILLARQVGVPLNLWLFGEPNPPLISPMLGLLGTVYGCHSDGQVDSADYAVWRESYGATFYPYPQVPLGWRRVTLEWDDGCWQLDFGNR